MADLRIRWKNVRFCEENNTFIEKPIFYVTMSNSKVFVRTSKNKGIRLAEKLGKVDKKLKEWLKKN